MRGVVNEVFRGSPGDELRANQQHGSLFACTTPAAEELVAIVPGISMRSAGPGQTEYEMRGLSSAGGVSPTVGFYLDEMPLTAPAAALNGKKADQWPVSLFVTNRTNKKAAITTNNANVSSVIPASTRVTKNHPRTGGVDVQFKS